jgi:hypothetical protein
LDMSPSTTVTFGSEASFRAEGLEALRVTARTKKSEVRDRARTTYEGSLGYYARVVPRPRGLGKEERTEPP